MVGDGWRCWQWQCLLLLSMFVDLAVAGSMCKVQQYQIIKIIRCDYSRWRLQHTKARLYRQNISPALDFTGLQAYYSILQCDSIKLQSQWWHPGPTAGSNVAQIDLRRPTYFGWALPPKTFFLMFMTNLSPRPILAAIFLVRHRSRNCHSYPIHLQRQACPCGPISSQQMLVSICWL